MTQNWAMYHHTNPMTGEPMPELINWSGAPQVLNKNNNNTLFYPFILMFLFLVLGEARSV